MNESLDPLPPDIIEKLSTLTPPPPEPQLAERLLPGIRAAARVPVPAAPWPWWGRMPPWVPVATLLVGAAVGIAIDRQLRDPLPAPPPEIRFVVASPEGPAAPPDVPAPSPPAPQRKEPRHRLLPPVVAEPEAPPPDRLREERVLIDVARAALRRNPEDGLVAIRQHEDAFLHGQLAEEREALAVQLLLRLGRRDEARQRFEAFARGFPGSALGAALAPSFAPLDGGAQ